jgi:hypothetical protein
MKTGRGLLALAAFGVLTLLGLYVGAYYATVRAIRWPGFISSTYHPGGVSLAYRPIPGINSRWLFAPVHAIDRKLRPDVWNPPFAPPSNTLSGQYRA